MWKCAPYPLGSPWFIHQRLPSNIAITHSTLCLPLLHTSALCASLHLSFSNHSFDMAGSSSEFHNDPNFKPWGPFVSPTFISEPISRTDIITASVVWGLTVLAAITAGFLAYGQTKSSRSPLRSPYVCMMWIELAVCFAMGIECYLHMLKFIRPSMSLC